MAFILFITTIILLHVIGIQIELGLNKRLTEAQHRIEFERLKLSLRLEKERKRKYMQSAILTEVVEVTSTEAALRCKDCSWKGLAKECKTEAQDCGYSKATFYLCPKCATVLGENYAE